MELPKLVASVEGGAVGLDRLGKSRDSRIPMESTVCVMAAAKINLFLRVGKPRADGFHPLASWMCQIGLRDRLRLTRAPADVAAGAEISLTCDAAGIPLDSRNLVWRAIESMRDLIGAARIEAHLEKRIPSGAGLGGGSSDAAAALRAVATLAGVELSADELTRRGAALGSDVPFFAHAPSAMCRGRGEIVTPAPAPKPKWIVLLLPDIHMPTPEVYRRFDAMGLGLDARDLAAIDIGPLATMDAAGLASALVNDLEPAAFAIRPDLGELRLEAERLIGAAVRMSGSGSSLFALFDDLPRAQDASETLRRHVGILSRAVELAPSPSAGPLDELSR